MNQDSFTFDADAGRLAKEAGQSRAILTNYSERHKLLEFARSFAHSYAKTHGRVTSDDVRKCFLETGLSWETLGNAAGSIFRGNQYECIGTKSSEVVSRHSNLIRIWRLRENRDCR